VTAWEPPLWGHIGRDGRWRYTEGLGVQVVDTKEGLLECAGALGPGLSHTQGIKARRQPSSGAIAGQDLVGQSATGRVWMRGAPRQRDRAEGRLRR
jgi:hypothetical protein